MRLDSALAILKRNLEVGTVTFLMGPPGIGKTDAIETVADDVARPCLTESLATYESVDLRGLPMIGNGAVTWAKPDFLTKLEALATDTGKAPIFFIDEANANAQSVQVPLMQLALKRAIGPHKLPAGTSIVMAGNRVADRAAAQKIPTALANRVCFLDIDVDRDAWLKWAARVRLSPVVTAFIMAKGAPGPNTKGLLSTFDPGKPDQRAFASPRSWSEVAKHDDTPASLLGDIARGLVGEAEAGEFMSFRELFTKVPRIPAIIADPNNAAVPAEASLRYLVAVALAQAAKPGTFQAVLTYAARMGSELEVVTITEAARRNPELCQTTAFTMWHAANPEVSL